MDIQTVAPRPTVLPSPDRDYTMWIVMAIVGLILVVGGTLFSMNGFPSIHAMRATTPIGQNGALTAPLVPATTNPAEALSPVSPKNVE